MNRKTLLIDEDRVRGCVVDLLNEYELEATEADIDILEDKADKDDAIGFNNHLDAISKREIKVLYLMHQNMNIPFGIVIANLKLDTPDINFDKMKEKKWLLFDTDSAVESVKENPTYPLYVGSSMWTCNCKQNFIHTQFRAECDKCGTGIRWSTQKTKMLRELF